MYIFMMPSKMLSPREIIQTNVALKFRICRGHMVEDIS